ncbi:MAG: enoyl-CoA hydratase/isomerase family protein [Hoeflea sp.]|uniref:enoyl-CoA hydratase/isomerase family protein n=1 Tax=Hoeflea sp. TaxID=1940281 RepID=UPI001D2027C9|nr:enoyl-CoA hydratase/isomerase family protein [Hoeflea sp.]MBU4529435.1 enoyl-CoA hydratase/isomerase family protein [Alphaproteobacteria bacterium]MBU4546554.1 enoyl-CoA hydratase/isomerase family protein [Alphaproteobacteria bacterium]MBU4550822.1 enoyl-CoA hydratase/isomerase family protein [Alphaproteobacteria bacterium]MBV1723764.1 enoyl-CoA hydratase/isomerase family protein [Hoeflea sp.]MBV1763041.1 enoyl-CoA hydratase/isomerase family protein [Hoeflea sp.]
MSIRIRKIGRIGQITLQRPEALNAVTHEMVLKIEAALDGWREDDRVACVLIDAEGHKAFSAGGDLQHMHDTASKGDFEAGRRFWRDEYRLNAKIASYPKPYIALCQGFVMGGGVGVSLHGSHRVVGESAKIAMPECAVGLAPDVGGSLLLARAPGHLGEYLGVTGTRMNASDAILAGFADYFIPEAEWSGLTETLIETGDWSAVASLARDPEDGPLMALRGQVDAIFGKATLTEMLASLPDTDWGTATMKAIRAASPLSAACTIELVRRARANDDIRMALQQEYRFTSRSASDGDFIEGIRAAIIDKDRNPRWRHASIEDVTASEVEVMLAEPPGGDIAV